MLNWNDLRYLLAVAREGSTLAAARRLGVNQSTVHRRLKALEQDLGRPVAVRRPSGYELTEFGHHLLVHAYSVEDAVIATEIAAAGFRSAPEGTVRLTCPEPVLERLAVSGVFSRFAAHYPAITLTFKVSDHYVDLWRGDADVALRSGDPDNDRLVGRKVADSHWALYASRDYIEQHGRPEAFQDLAHHGFVAFDGPMQGHRANTWLERTVPEARVVARNSSVLGVLATAAAGIGVAALPTTIADGQERLVQLLAVPDLTRGWYLLTRPDLRTEPRVAALFDFLIRELPAVRAALMG